MKIRTILSLALTFVISSSVAFAADEDTALMKEMKVMNKNLRTLKRQAADPAKKDENLALLALIKSSTEKSHGLDPAKSKDVAAADKPAYLEKYHAQMRDLLQTFSDLEAAIKADKTDEAQKLFEKLSDQKEKGHKDFAPEE